MAPWLLLPSGPGLHVSVYRLPRSGHCDLLLKGNIAQDTCAGGVWPNPRACPCLPGVDQSVWTTWIPPGKMASDGAPASLPVMLSSRLTLWMELCWTPRPRWGLWTACRLLAPRFPHPCLRVLEEMSVAAGWWSLALVCAPYPAPAAGPRAVLVGAGDDQRVEGPGSSCVSLRPVSGTGPF